MRHSLDSILGQKSKIKILRYLIKSSDSHTGRQIATAIGVNHSACNLALGDLVEANVLIRRSVGRAFTYKVNQEFSFYSALKEIFNTEDDIYHSMAQLIASRIKQISEVISIILFGSHARDEAKLTSDIDLLIITVNEVSQDYMEIIAAECLSRFGRIVEPLFYTPEKFTKNYNSDQALIRNIMHEGRVLYGQSPGELISGRNKKQNKSR